LPVYLDSIWSKVSREALASTRFALLGILALAAWLRFDGIGFGLDLSAGDDALITNDVDARGMVLEELALLDHGDLNPGVFQLRGPASFLVFGVADAAVVAVLAPFRPGGWSGVVNELRTNPSLLHLVHRSISALAGVLTVALVFRMVRRELGVAAARASALILAVAYLHVRDSHFATVDVLSGFMSLAAIDQMLLLLRDPRPARYLASGLLAGAATATKYFGIVLGLHLVLAHFLARGKGERVNRGGAPRHVWLVLALLACPIGFLLVSPTVLLSPGDLVERVLRNAHKLRPRSLGGQLCSNLMFHARLTLSNGLGEPALLLALIGFWPLWRRRPAGRFLVPGSLLLASALFATRAECARYGIPFLVSLSIPAGMGLASLQSSLPSPASALLACLVLAPSFARSFTFDQLVKRRDTRIEMLSVLRQRGQPASDVLAIGRALDLPVPERWVRAPYHKDCRRSGSSCPSEIRSSPPRSILLSLSTPRDAIPDRPALEELLATRYREVLRLEVGEDPVGILEPNGGVRALRVAYTSPWRQTRPGPGLVLYELVQPPDEARPEPTVGRQRSEHLSQRWTLPHVKGTRSAGLEGQ
jgi:hypothetical protein